VGIDESGRRVNQDPLPYSLSYLKQDFLRRKARNPRFSQRAYARYLGIDPSALNRLLSGKEDLSSATYVRIAQRLQMTESDQNLFFQSVMERKNRRAAEKLLRLGIRLSA